MLLVESKEHFIFLNEKFAHAHKTSEQEQFSSNSVQCFHGKLTDSCGKWDQLVNHSFPVQPLPTTFDISNDSGILDSSGKTTTD